MKYSILIESVAIIDYYWCIWHGHNCQRNSSWCRWERSIIGSKIKWIRSRIIESRGIGKWSIRKENQRSIYRKGWRSICQYISFSIGSCKSSREDSIFIECISRSCYCRSSISNSDTDSDGSSIWERPTLVHHTIWEYLCSTKSSVRRVLELIKIYRESTICWSREARYSECLNLIGCIDIRIICEHINHERYSSSSASCIIDGYWSIIDAVYLYSLNLGISIVSELVSSTKTEIINSTIIGIWIVLKASRWIYNQWSVSNKIATEFFEENSISRIKIDSTESSIYLARIFWSSCRGRIYIWWCIRGGYRYTTLSWSYIIESIDWDVGDSIIRWDECDHSSRGNRLTDRTCVSSIVEYLREWIASSPAYIDWLTRRYGSCRNSESTSRGIENIWTIVPEDEARSISWYCYRPPDSSIDSIYIGKTWHSSRTRLNIGWSSCIRKYKYLIRIGIFYYGINTTDTHTIELIVHTLIGCFKTEIRITCRTLDCNIEREGSPGRACICLCDTVWVDIILVSRLMEESSKIHIPWRWSHISSDKVGLTCRNTENIITRHPYTIRSPSWWGDSSRASYIWSYRIIGEYWSKSRISCDRPSARISIKVWICEKIRRSKWSSITIGLVSEILKFDDACIELIEGIFGIFFRKSSEVHTPDVGSIGFIIWINSIPGWREKSGRKVRSWNFITHFYIWIVWVFLKDRIGRKSIIIGESSILLGSKYWSGSRSEKCIVRYSKSIRIDNSQCIFCIYDTIGTDIGTRDIIGEYSIASCSWDSWAYSCDRILCNGRSNCSSWKRRIIFHCSTQWWSRATAIGHDILCDTSILTVYDCILCYIRECILGDDHWKTTRNIQGILGDSRQTISCDIHFTSTHIHTILTSWEGISCHTRSSRVHDIKTYSAPVCDRSIRKIHSIWSADIYGASYHWGDETYIVNIYVWRVCDIYTINSWLTGTTWTAITIDCDRKSESTIGIIDRQYFIPCIGTEKWYDIPLKERSTIYFWYRLPGCTSSESIIEVTSARRVYVVLRRICKGELQCWCYTIRKKQYEDNTSNKTEFCTFIGHTNLYKKIWSLLLDHIYDIYANLGVYFSEIIRISYPKSLSLVVVSP